jgi:hypothetical protein
MSIYLIPGRFILIGILNSRYYLYTKNVSVRKSIIAGDIFMDTGMLGKVLVCFGLLIILLGVVTMSAAKIPWLGKLPGDLAFQIGGMKVFAPLATCLLISLILIIFLNLVMGRR